MDSRTRDQRIRWHVAELVPEILFGERLCACSLQRVVVEKSAHELQVSGTRLVQARQHAVDDRRGRSLAKLPSRSRRALLRTIVYFPAAIVTRIHAARTGRGYRFAAVQRDGPCV